MKSPIIVTGLSGYLGQRLKELLGNKFRLIDFSRRSGVDLTRYSQLKEAFAQHPQANIVLHLAAFTDTKAAWEQRGDRKGECYQVNVIGTRNLVDLLQKKDGYLIYISTDFVFSGQSQGVYTEEDEPSPIEWYGYTKYLGEQLVLRSGLRAAIVRISFPYQARSEAKKDLVARIREGLAKRQLFPMFRDQTITLTLVDDIVAGLPVFWQKEVEGIFHLVGSYHSPYQAAQLVAEAFGFDPAMVKPGSLIEYLKKQPPGSRPWQKNLALSNKKVTRELGIRMRSFPEGLTVIRQQLEEK